MRLALKTPRFFAEQDRLLLLNYPNLWVLRPHYIAWMVPPLALLSFFFSATIPISPERLLQDDFAGLFVDFVLAGPLLFRWFRIQFWHAQALPVRGAASGLNFFTGRTLCLWWMALIPMSYMIAMDLGTVSKHDKNGYLCDLAAIGVLQASGSEFWSGVRLPGTSVPSAPLDCLSPANADKIFRRYRTSTTSLPTPDEISKSLDYIAWKYGLLPDLTPDDHSIEGLIPAWMVWACFATPACLALWVLGAYRIARPWHYLATYLLLIPVSGVLRVCLLVNFR
jgi:hypothetical protein